MSIVVFATESAEGGAALEWAIDARNIAEDEHLHLVIGASDIPARPAYISDATAERLAARARDQGVPYTAHPAGDDAAQFVLDLAERESARLIVLGLRRRTATMKMLLGSHVQYILTGAERPVVCVR